MNILSKIFGNKTKTDNPESILTGEQSTVYINQPQNSPPFDLFIDKEPPMSEKQIDILVESKLTIFLNLNYHPIGVNDGFEYHSQETLETGKKKIITEFQLILDQEIEAMSQRKLKLKTLVIDVLNISDETWQKLELAIEEIKKAILKLELQKELSVENEGWVMNLIHSYQQGFVQGLNDYIASENLLNSSNFFNSIK